MRPVNSKPVNAPAHGVLNDSLLRGRMSAVVRVNGSFLMASLFGWIAWELWNWDTSFYGVTLMEIMAALVAVSCLISALVQIGKLYARERAIAAYISQGYKPKTSELAGDDALDQAGMR